MRRIEKLVTGETYHIFTKSIAGFKMFNNNNEFLRIKDMLRYYQMASTPLKFYRYMQLKKINEEEFDRQFVLDFQNAEKLVQIVAYCIMPTHLHLIIRQLKDNGISLFMGNLLNSYSRYFNSKYKRKGPLWEGRFKGILVKTDEQLMHLTRYIHLNPVTSYLVNSPREWMASSYQEYLSNTKNYTYMCEYDNLFEINPSSYKKFVEDFISYQREIGKIKELVLETL